MRRRRPNTSRTVQNRPAPIDDLFDYAQRATPAAKPMDDELWNVKTIAAKTGLARSTIYAYVKHGHFPRQRKLGPRRVGWLASEVRSWMAKLRPTSAYDGASSAE